MMCLTLLYLLCFTLQVRYKLRLAGVMTNQTDGTFDESLAVVPLFCARSPILDRMPTSVVLVGSSCLSPIRGFEI